MKVSVGDSHKVAYAVIFVLGEVPKSVGHVSAAVDIVVNVSLDVAFAVSDHFEIAYRIVLVKRAVAKGIHHPNNTINGITNVGIAVFIAVRLARTAPFVVISVISNTPYQGVYLEKAVESIVTVAGDV